MFEHLSDATCVDACHLKRKSKSKKTFKHDETRNMNVNEEKALNFDDTK